MGRRAWPCELPTYLDWYYHDFTTASNCSQMSQRTVGSSSRSPSELMSDTDTPRQPPESVMESITRSHTIINQWHPGSDFTLRKVGAECHKSDRVQEDGRRQSGQQLRAFSAGGHTHGQQSNNSLQSKRIRAHARTSFTTSTDFKDGISKRMSYRILQESNILARSSVLSRDPEYSISYLRIRASGGKHT